MWTAEVLPFDIIILGIMDRDDIGCSLRLSV
jgi:hypothetical protein